MAERPAKRIRISSPTSSSSSPYPHLLSTIPFETLIEVFSFAEKSQLLILRLVCSSWQHTVNHSWLKTRPACEIRFVIQTTRGLLALVESAPVAGDGVGRHLLSRVGSMWRMRQERHEDRLKHHIVEWGEMLMEKTESEERRSGFVEVVQKLNSRIQLLRCDCSTRQRSYCDDRGENSLLILAIDWDFEIDIPGICRIECIDARDRTASVDEFPEYETEPYDFEDPAYVLREALCNLLVRYPLSTPLESTSSHSGRRIQTSWRSLRIDSGQSQLLDLWTALGVDPKVGRVFDLRCCLVDFLLNGTGRQGDQSRFWSHDSFQISDGVVRRPPLERVLYRDEVEGEFEGESY